MTSAAEPDPGTTDAVRAKRSLRRELLALRRALPAADVAAASARVVALLRDLPEVKQATTMLLYVADPDEIDVSALRDAAPSVRTVLLPRVEGDRLVTVRHMPGDDLVVGALGVREPVGPAVDPSPVDVVIVPGVAFDPAGGRLGRGRGLYDRLLAQLPQAVHIGVCVEQLVVDVVPCEPHDVRVDVLVSDASVRRRDADVHDAPT